MIYEDSHADTTRSHLLIADNFLLHIFLIKKSKDHKYCDRHVEEEKMRIRAQKKIKLRFCCVKLNCLCTEHNPLSYRTFFPFRVASIFGQEKKIILRFRQFGAKKSKKKLNDAELFCDGQGMKTFLIKKINFKRIC